MELPDTIFVGVGIVVGAISGALITTFISRAQTISEFRQKWIDDVRDNFTLFLNEADNYSDAVLDIAPDGTRADTSNEKRKLLHQIHKIKLYLNIEETEHQKLLEKLSEILKLISNFESQEKYENLREEVTKEMQSILKNEWNRVRDGEWLWKVKKYIKMNCSK